MVLIFSNFKNFWSILQNSMLKKFFFQGSFTKFDICKEIYLNSFPKINKRWSFKFKFTRFCYCIFSNNKKQRVYSLKYMLNMENQFGFFLFKVSPKAEVLIQITFLYFMFSLKVWFICFWCRTFENFERRLLLQFPNAVKLGR